MEMGNQGGSKRHGDHAEEEDQAEEGEVDRKSLCDTLSVSVERPKGKGDTHDTAEHVGKLDKVDGARSRERDKEAEAF